MRNYPPALALTFVLVTGISYAPAIFGANQTEVVLPGGAAPIELSHGLPADNFVALERLETLDWDIILLPAGLEALAVSENNIVVLRDPVTGASYRWIDGALDRLGDDFDSYGFVQNASGSIATSGFRRGPEYSGIDQVRVLRPEDRSFGFLYERPFRTYTAINVDNGQPYEGLSQPGSWVGFDDAGRLWFQRFGGFYPYSEAEAFRAWSVDAAGSAHEVPTFGWRVIEVSRGGHLVTFADRFHSDYDGSRWYLGGHLHENIWYQGVNKYGTALAWKPTGTYVLIDLNGHQEDLSLAGQLYRIDDDGSLYAFDQGHFVYRRQRGPDGLPAEPASYERKDYVPLVLPDGWNTSLAMASDEEHPQLGLATRTANGDSETRAFLAMRAHRTFSLSVDMNRDGKIDPADPADLTTEAAPFRFWLNDDFDREHVVNNDLFQTTIEQDDVESSPDGKYDWQENLVVSDRDLEDFSRLWISTQGLTAAIRPKDGTDQAEADLYLGLQWAPDEKTGAPAIKIYPAVEADGGTKYLTVPAVADQQVDFDYAMTDFRDTATPGISLNNVVGGTDFFVIPPRYFVRLSDAQPKIFFLFEGVSAGKGQLKLVILKKENGFFTKIGDGPGVWFDLQNIRNLYQTWTMGDNTIPGVHAEVTPALTHTAVSGSPTLPAPATEEENDFILFVHGWNMPTFEKDRFAETAFKRLWWQGYKGRFGSFRWPTYYTVTHDPNGVGPLFDPQNYDASELNSWKSAPGLLQLLTELKGTYHDANGSSRVRVLAHSHGNIATSEAMRLAATPIVHTYVASQAAIAAHCFDRDAPDISGNWQNEHFFLALIDELHLQPVIVTTPNVYAYYPGSAGLDRHVQFPTTGQPYMTGAVGGQKWINYYNRNDWALDGWIIDQALKPGGSFDYRPFVDILHLDLFWSFADDSRSGFPGLSIPTDIYSIFSFAAQARSQPLGRQPGVMGLFNGQERSWDTFGDKHPGHSAEFRSSIAQRGDYWKQLLISFALKAAS